MGKTSPFFASAGRVTSKLKNSPSIPLSEFEEVATKRPFIPSDSLVSSSPESIFRFSVASPFLMIILPWLSLSGVSLLS